MMIYLCNVEAIALIHEFKPIKMRKGICMWVHGERDGQREKREDVWERKKKQGKSDCKGPVQMNMHFFYSHVKGEEKVGTK